MINASLDKCLNGLFQKKSKLGSRKGEDMEFPGVLKK